MASITGPSDDGTSPPASPMEITVQGEGPDIVLVVEGELDLSTTASLRACLDHAAADSCGTVVLDLAGVSFMDSSGLAAIAMLHRGLSESGRSVELRSPSPFAAKVLDISGLAALIAQDQASSIVYGMPKAAAANPMAVTRIVTTTAPSTRCNAPVSPCSTPRGCIGANCPTVRARIPIASKRPPTTRILRRPAADCQTPMPKAVRRR